MATEREMTTALHPNPNKKGARVNKATFDVYCAAVLEAIPATAEGIMLKELTTVVEALVPAEIVANTSVMWWTMSAKLHFEALGKIERVPKAKPQRLRRIQS